MSDTQGFFATTAKYLEPLLADELANFGAQSIKQTVGGVHFEGELKHAYTACLWSRIANRILLPLSTFTAPDADALYLGAQSIHWLRHFNVNNTFAIDCVSVNSQLSHSHFCAQKIKDAIVDQFNREINERPSVNTDSPEIRINCFLKNDIATLSLDLSGDSLHRRGYRTKGAGAPLKENLAAAILQRAKWKDIAQQGGSLIDPMCGSGTLVIEAAMLAADIAPGLLRKTFGFLAWKQHDDWLWQNLTEEAERRKQQGLINMPLIFGFDNHQPTLDIARDNIKRAQLEDYIVLDNIGVAQLTCPQQAKTGLIITNPPYGERLGTYSELFPLYQRLGETLRAEFLHWQAAVITSEAELGKAIGIRAHHIHKFYNGALECQLLHFTLESEWYMHQVQSTIGPSLSGTDPLALGTGAEMFANRLKKNIKQIGGWADKQGIRCYRLYDADMPEYAVAIDIYRAVQDASMPQQIPEQRWVHVQEYAPPATIAPEKARRRLREILSVLPSTLHVDAEDIFLKTREKQKGSSQYMRHAHQQQMFEVEENGLVFLVNFSDYLDTGLFLDHRPTRQLIRELAKGKDFLNLFSYTGTASVYAASGGAKSTTSIDMSRTYLEWSKNNFRANNIPLTKHEFIQEDCLGWLKQPLQQQFDLIFLDPPTFSNSKRMSNSFDVQRDHEWLLQQTMRRLKPGGTLIFSNNFRKFKMSPAILEQYEVQDITSKTLEKDFQRNTRIHNCWRLTQTAKAKPKHKETLQIWQ